MTETTTQTTSQRLDPVEMLGERFRAAIAEAFEGKIDQDAIDPLITPSKNP